MKKFNNRENELITDTNGKQHWISRSMAVAGVIIALHGKDIYVLTEQRTAILDEPNKWGVISGYLDWDETTYEAIKRETYEETAFDIDKYENNLIYDHNKEPFGITSRGSADVKQNVTLSYIFIYKFDQMPLEIEQFTSDEVSKVKWLNLEDFLRDEAEIEWAFDHNKKIHIAIQKFLSK